MIFMALGRTGGLARGHAHPPPPPHRQTDKHTQTIKQTKVCGEIVHLYELFDNDFWGWPKYGAKNKLSEYVAS